MSAVSAGSKETSSSATTPQTTASETVASPESSPTARPTATGKRGAGRKPKKITKSEAVEAKPTPEVVATAAKPITTAAKPVDPSSSAETMDTALELPTAKTATLTAAQRRAAAAAARKQSPPPATAGRTTRQRHNNTAATTTATVETNNNNNNQIDITTATATTTVKLPEPIHSTVRPTTAAAVRSYGRKRKAPADEQPQQPQPDSETVPTSKSAIVDAEMPPQNCAPIATNATTAEDATPPAVVATAQTPPAAVAAASSTIPHSSAEPIAATATATATTTTTTEPAAVKLIISKKKGSIFKSRATEATAAAAAAAGGGIAADGTAAAPTSGTAKRHQLYRHKWDHDAAANSSVTDGMTADDSDHGAGDGKSASHRAASTMMDFSDDDVGRKTHSNGFGAPSGDEQPLSLAMHKMRGNATSTMRGSPHLSAMDGGGGGGQGGDGGGDGCSSRVRNVKNAHQIQEIGEYQVSISQRSLVVTIDCSE